MENIQNLPKGGFAGPNNLVNVRKFIHQRILRSCDVKDMVRGFETAHLLSSQMLAPATGAAHHCVCSKCNALLAVKRRPKTPGVCIELMFGNPRCCSVQLVLDAACFHFCRYWWMFSSHHLSVFRRILFANSQCTSHINSTFTQKSEHNTVSTIHISAIPPATADIMIHS